MADSAVRWKNKAFWGQLKSRLEKMPGKQLAVGYPANAEGVANPHYENGASIIEVAIYNNYGLGVPRRDFFEQAREPIQELGRKTLGAHMHAINIGEEQYEKVLSLIGVQAENEIRKSIRDGNWQPNAPETVERKGSEHPLIDTGAMIQNVTHVVR